MALKLCGGAVSWHLAYWALFPTTSEEPGKYEECNKLSDVPNNVPGGTQDGEPTISVHALAMLYVSEYTHLELVLAVMLIAVPVSKTVFDKEPAGWALSHSGATHQPLSQPKSPRQSISLLQGLLNLNGTLHE